MSEIVVAVIGFALLVFGSVRLIRLGAQTRVAVSCAQGLEARTEKSPLAQFWLDETRTRKTLLWTGIGCVVAGVALLVAALMG